MTVTLFVKYTLKINTGTHTKLYSSAHVFFFFMVRLLYMHSLHLIISSFMLYFGKRKIIGLAEFLDQAMPCDVSVISERCQYQLVFCRDFHTVIVLARLPLFYVIMHQKMVP